VKPGEPRWEIELRNYPRGLEERIRGYGDLIKMNKRLLDLWEPRPLPGEPGHRSVSALLHEQYSKARGAGYHAVKLNGKVYPVEPV
jgi:hypothetical protein